MRSRLEKLAKFLALPAAAGIAACGQGADQPPQNASDGATAGSTADTVPAPAKHGVKRSRERSFLIAHVRKGKALLLRKRPGGPVVTRLSSTTEFGDPTAVTVVATKGDWLGVTTPTLPNRRLGWFRRGTPSVKLTRTKTWLKVDLGKRQLQLRRGDRVVEHVSVGVGAPGSPTPTGIFSVTDKLSGTRFGSIYGRFILALSGRQPRTPRGWAGGDRLAIHGTNTPTRIGERASAGCIEAPDPALEKLVAEVPQGAPVVIDS